MDNKNSIETAIKLIADGRLSREVAKELFPGVEFDENEITKGEIIAFLKKEYKGRWVQWIEDNCTKRPVGVEIIDDDTLRLTDEYCSFIIHRPAEKEIAAGHEHNVYISEDIYYEQLKKQWEDGYNKGRAAALEKLPGFKEDSHD